MGKLETQFASVQNLELPGFGRKLWYGGLQHRFIRANAASDQFDQFCQRILGALGKRHLPIYRMADGEFQFLLARRCRTAFCNMQTFRAWAFGMRTCWGERYTRSEYASVYERLVQSIRQVASVGMIGLYFAIRTDKWGEEYFRPMCKWFEQNKIQLSSDNYIPFYFVYALLSGPVSRELFYNRNVLIITHYDESKRSMLERSLIARGAKKVSFINISATRSALVKLDLSSLVCTQDISLVGGGIGSVSIVEQLAPLGAPAIDAGIFLETLVNPSRRTERPFLCSDECWRQ